MTLDAIKVAMIDAFESKPKRKTVASRLKRAVLERAGDGSLVIKHYSSSAAQEIEKYDYEIRAMLSDLGEEAGLAVKWDPCVGDVPLTLENARPALMEYFRERNPSLHGLLASAKSETGSSWHEPRTLLLYIEDGEERKRLLEQMPAIRVALARMMGEGIEVKVFARSVSDAYYAACERVTQENPDLSALLEDTSVSYSYSRRSSSRTVEGVRLTPLFEETESGLLEHREKLEAALREARGGDVTLDIKKAYYTADRLKAKPRKTEWGFGEPHLTESQQAKVDALRAEARAKAQEEARPQMPADKRLTELVEQLRGFADQLVAAAEGQGLENLKNVLVPKTGVDTIDVFSEGWDAEDCIHLHACRRLAAIAKKNGERFARGCNSKCSAYEAGE